MQMVISLEDILENQGAILGRQEQIMATQHETIFYVVIATFGMILLMAVLMYLTYNQLLKRMDAIYGTASEFNKNINFVEKLKNMDDVEKNTIIIAGSMKIVSSTLQLVAMNLVEIKDDLKTTLANSETELRILPSIEENYKLINEVLTKLESVKTCNEILPCIQDEVK